VKYVLRESFEKAGLPAEIEVYDGALHGWCPPDSAVYNEAQAERAWAACWRCWKQRWLDHGDRPRLMRVLKKTWPVFKDANTRR
jgi:dienelactone hydrolase